MLGIIAFNFGHESSEALAKEVQRLIEDEIKPVVVAEFSVALQLRPKFVDFMVDKHRAEGHDLDSMEVVSQAVEVLRHHKATEVIIVAPKSLRLKRCEELLTSAGFTLKPRW